MKKIASTTELTGELQRLLAYAASFRPSRAKLASDMAKLARALAPKSAAAREEDILHETENLYLFKTSKGLEIRLNSKSGTHSVVVGKPKDVESAKRTMERLERYPDNLREMYKEAAEPSESSRRNRVNKALDTLCKQYFKSLPLPEIKDILDSNGFNGEAVDGIYTGREGRSHEQVGPKSWLSMTWHKMEESGNWEVVAYVS